MIGSKVSVIIPTRNRIDAIVDCLKSLEKVKYSSREIIVIDDASSDNTFSEIQKNFPNTILIKNEVSEGASISRNKGSKASSGEYLFFLDSDTVVDEWVLDELVKGFNDFSSSGLVAPIICYYEDGKKIWYAGASIDLLTSKAHYRDIGKIDRGKFWKKEILKNGHAPTAFMVKKTVFDLVGGFNPTFFMGFEEPDLAKRIENMGYQIIFNPKAKVWHKIPTLRYKNKLSEFLYYISFRTPKIAYLTSRNRIRYMRKYAPTLNYMLFLVFFLPISLLVYLLKSILSRQPRMIFNIILGTIDGLREVVLKEK